MENHQSRPCSASGQGGRGQDPGLGFCSLGLHGELKSEPNVMKIAPMPREQEGISDSKEPPRSPAQVLADDTPHSPSHPTHCCLMKAVLGMWNAVTEPLDVGFLESGRLETQSQMQPQSSPYLRLLARESFLSWNYPGWSWHRGRE